MINIYAVLIAGLILLSCNSKVDYLKEEVLSLEQQQDLRWVQADSCECFVLNSFATNPLDSVYISWTGTDTNGLADGFGKLILGTVNGDSVYYTGSISNGKIKGHGTLYKPDKSTYVGELYYLEYGRGRRTYENGETEDGIFLDGVLHTGTIEKIDTTEFVYGGSILSESEYIRRIKQRDKYLIAPKLGEVTRQYYDSLWIPSNKNDASYYRLVTMLDDSHPKGGMVKDFYINGDKQNFFQVEHINLKHEINIYFGKSQRFTPDGLHEQTYLNSKLIKEDLYRPDGGLRKKGWLRDDYSQEYIFNDEFGNFETKVIIDNQGKHRYEKSAKGDSIYTVFDTLEFSRYSLKFLFYTNGKIKSKTTTIQKRLIDYSTISEIQHFLGNGELFKTEYYLQLNRSNEVGDDIEQLSTVHTENADVLWNNTSTEHYFTERLDYSFIRNRHSRLSFWMKGESSKSSSYFEIDYGSRDNFESDFNSLVFFPNWDKPKIVSVRKSTDGLKERVDYDSDDMSDGGFVYLNNLGTDSMSLDGFNHERISMPFTSNTPEIIRLLVGKDDSWKLSNIKVEVFENLKGLEKQNISNESNIKNESLPWKSYGSGVVLTGDGYVVTNHHVIEDASDIEIGLVENNKIRYYSGEIISKDINNDLALVRISDNSFKGFDRIPYNVELDQASVGKEVFALGYPLKALLGDELKFTNGRISARSGAIGDISKYQMTVPLQPGNSGGPVFDFDGNLIGIAQGGIKYDVAENVAYCVKTTYLQSLVESLPEKFGLPDDRRNRGEDVEDIINEVAPYVTLIRVR